MNPTITITCDNAKCDAHCSNCFQWIKKAMNFKPHDKRPYDAYLMYLRSRNLKEGKKPSQSPIKGWCLITINPDTSKLSLEEFITLMLKTFQRKLFNSATIAFEQRGEDADNLGYGFHCHALVQLGDGKKPKDVRRDLARSFVKGKNPICGNPKHIDVRRLATSRDKHNAFAYISGEKDASKTDKALMDIEWREINKIEPLYHV